MSRRVGDLSGLYALLYVLLQSLVLRCEPAFFVILTLYDEVSCNDSLFDQHVNKGSVPYWGQRGVVLAGP